jgi:hypothetical protein
MKKLLKKLNRNKVIQFLASLKIGVICLLLLFILTFWGTVAQVQNGLYAAQERYFSSFYFLAMGFLPFPGGQLVLWVLFVNLTCAFFTRIVFAGEKIGLMITHLGLILFLFAAYVTMHEAVESHLTLREGASSNVSRAYADWEIAVWPVQPQSAAKTVLAQDIKNLKEGGLLTFQPENKSFDVNFTVKTYYPNADGLSAPFAGIKEKYLNASGINVLRPKALDKEREKNIPALILETPDKSLLLLYGLDDDATKIRVGENEYFVSLRNKRYPMPLRVKLLDFMMDKHPGTEVARSYKSKVEIEHDGVRRETVISMNEPLRFKDYTFYQSSYQIDSLGREASTFSVVKNSGRLLPYIATFVVFFGLAYHFLLAAFKFKRSRK